MIWEFCGADAVTNVSFTCVRFKKFVLALYKSLTPVPLITEYLNPSPLEGFNKRDNSKQFFAPARLLNGEFLSSPLFDQRKVCKIEHKQNASFFAYYVRSPYDFERRHEGTLDDWTYVRNPNSKVSNSRLTHCLVATKPDVVTQITATGRLNVKDQLELIGEIGSQAIVRHEIKDPNALYKYEFLLNGNAIFKWTNESDVLIYKDVIFFFERPGPFIIEITPFRVFNGRLKQHMSPNVRVNFSVLDREYLNIVPRPSISADEHNIILSWKKGPNKFQSLVPNDHILIQLFSKDPKDPIEWAHSAGFYGPCDAYVF